MLVTLIQKEIMHHILSVRFVALLLMCLLLIPLTLSINYRHYQQNRVDYQESVKLANIEETTINPQMELKPELEVSKLFLKPSPLSVFANGLGEALPSYLGMTRNGIVQGAPALVSDSLSYLLGHLDFLFLVGTVFSLLALLFTFDAVAGEREAGGLEMDKQVQPLEEEFRQKFKESADEIDRRYKRDKARQEGVGETLSRITPTSSLIYVATNLTQTGKTKRNNYFQAGDRYYDALDTDLFSKVLDYISMRTMRPEDTVKITQPLPWRL